MKFYPTLEQTLAQRFTDLDEVCDVSTHGITGGFNGFIYSTELAEFFNEFESEIEDKIDELGYTLADLVDPESWTFQQLKEQCVWIVAEEFCHRKAELCALV